MSKEYIYEIDKYTIGVDENGEDGFGMTVAKIENGEINFLGNCYGENARCLDLLIKENKQLKEQLLVTQTNEETFRLEMKDITQTLGLDEDTLFDDVKVYVRSLKDNWNKLKEWLKEYEEGTYGLGSYETGLSDGLGDVIKKMQELEGSDSNE